MITENEIPWEVMVEKAKSVRKNAHAPYSKFKVGATILAGGKFFTGCNVENASYPNGICAERSAICSMVSAGENRADAIVIVAGPKIPPCGMCRQTLSEFAKDMPIMLLGEDDGEQSLTNLSTLFPGPFSL